MLLNDRHQNLLESGQSVPLALTGAPSAKVPVHADIRRGLANVLFQTYFRVLAWAIWVGAL